MRELPDLSELSVSPGDPVVPDNLNQVSRYADVFRDHYGVEHRVEDFEHAPPFVPQACGLCVWDGKAYTVVGGSNIESVTALATGDVEIVLSISAQRADAWFPVVTVQNTPAGRACMWWDYDDDGRTARRCRIRFREYSIIDPVPVDVLPTFLFRAYMEARAPGIEGRGDSKPPRGLGVPHRICVDGVESAQHRQDLIDFVAAHRLRWRAGHDAAGKHPPHALPLAVAQVARPESPAAKGETIWSRGPLRSLAWSVAVEPDGFDWRVVSHLDWWLTTRQRMWRGANVSVRAKTDKLPVGAAGVLRWLHEDPDTGGRWRVNLGAIDGGADAFDAIVSVGLVLYGIP